MPTCFVFGCQSGSIWDPDSKSSSRPRLFRPPTENLLLKQWSIKIPRSDRKLDDKSRICEKHFVEDDIIKVNTVIKRGKEVSTPRKNWKLRKGALPSIFPHSPSSSKVLKTRRGPPLRAAAAQPEEQPRVDIDAANVLIDDVAMDIEENANRTSSFTEEAIDSVTLPVITGDDSFKWHIGREKDSSVQLRYYYLVHCSGGILNIRKMAFVNFTLRTIDYSVAQHKIITRLLPNSFESIMDLENILSTFCEIKTCSGVRNMKLASVQRNQVLTGYFDAGVWRSDKCKLIVDQLLDGEDTCKHCIRLEKSLLRSARRRSQKKKPDYKASKLNWRFMKPALLDKRHRALQRKVTTQRYQLVKKEIELQKIKKEFSELKDKFASISDDAATEVINSLKDEKVSRC